MTTTARARLRRLRPLVKRVTKWSAAIFAVVVGLLLLVAHNLDHPWVKRRIQALAAKNAGLDIDYGAVRLSMLSGIAIDDLVVRGPAESRAIVPEFARVGHASVAWSLSSSPSIQSVSLRDVTVSIAVDEKGRTSLDALFPPSPEPSPPLSHRTASIFGSAAPVGDVSVEHVKVALVKTEHGAEVQRTTIDGISLDAHGEPARAGWALHARLGDEAAPLALDVQHHGVENASGHAHVWVVADVDSTDAAIALGARVDDQTFVEGVHVAQALRASTRVRFDPKAAKTDALIEAEIGDGAAHAAGADLSLPDVGPPEIRFASGDLDGAKLIAMAPPELVPVSVERAQLRYRIRGLVLDTPPRMSEAGTVSIDGDVTGLRKQLANGAARVDGATFHVNASPAQGGIALHATAKVDAVKLEGATGVDATGIALAVDGRVSPERAVSADAKLEVASANVTGSSPASARTASVQLVVHDLVVDPANPMATRGDVALTSTVASLSARAGASRIAADDLALHAHAPLTGHAPFALDADATLAKLRVSDAAGRVLADDSARLTAKISNATPNLEKPITSTGNLLANVDFGAAHVDLDATKEADAVGYKLAASVPSLAVARPFVPAETAAAVPLDRMGVKLDSNGRVERIASSLPEIKHHTKLDVDQPGFATVAARSLSLVLDSNGNAMRHDADIDLRTQALSIAGLGMADDHVVIKAKIDRSRPSARVELQADGRAAISVTFDGAFDRAKRSLDYDVTAKFAKLSALAPVASAISGLDSIDLGTLDVDFSSKGSLLGVIRDVGSDGKLDLEPTPSATALVLGALDIHVAGFAFSRGAVAVSVPRIGWHADLGATGAQRTLVGKLDLPAARLAAGAHVLEVTGVTDRLSAAVLGDLHNPDADVSQKVEVHALKQDWAPSYPVGDVSLEWGARRDHAGIVHLKNLKLVNGSAGSELSVAGNLDLSGAQRRLALHGDVNQDLARLSKDGSLMSGSGTAALAVRFESGDLAVFRTRVDASLTNASFRLPRSNIVVEGASGIVPINIEFAARPTGVELLRNTQVSPYSMLRFSDQHPLLSRRSFVTIHSITTPWVSISPLVANLQVDRNILALEQLEMGIRQGRITGSCALDWKGEDSTLDLHVRATGVMSSHGEPFDGNAAVLVSARDRNIEGRADVLKIGKRHFLDMLDIVDPTRTDAAMNRVRSGLSLGYPDKLHLAFDHGFASMHIELGGLGSLLSIDDIRGIPIGPLVDRALRDKGNP